MATLAEIEILTKKFSEARADLKSRISYLEDEIAVLKRKYLPGIKKSIEAAASAKMRLHSEIEDSAELFVKPRTIIFHGIKIGYQKGKGEITWEDSEQVVKLIKKHYPGIFDAYIKITETPIKSALAQLPAAELKKLGIIIAETGDEIVIKGTDSDIDKMVNALFKDEEMEAREAA